MSQTIGHQACFDLLDQIMRGYEAAGYTRLVQYQPGGVVLMDSKPAPGYVPGVRGKKETGVEYTPKGDGTRVHIYYLAGHQASPKQIQEADRALRSGFDSHEIMGTLVSIRRVNPSTIQVQFIAGNRDHIENNVITGKVALRSVSVTREPAEKGGLIVALALDQMLGIPYSALQNMLASEASASSGQISDRLRAVADAARREGIPDRVIGSEAQTEAMSSQEE